ncbi:MAG: NADH-quinone oxidoreductase subunit A [Bdellovibrionales bacterium GWC1_52_8]|nr:MAG: NADH-quinone oxidoreductase subunit A [Bdellovibrionales bacterium GWB1_52_6]OFZ05819.1 MAG: NADH-quinone oxidoreductase subunit A [Bdellovibrionales bacterium GWA1_52_35]OFZ39328.1 MAG: NADH-quinone oxidoreductase subunit A [Bdellovibrionales bacterium GWC1_52_8]HCM40236.1 NADH-quinone oxidoreductase subunit A [Bdellovibrionales bacterium]
MMDYFLVLPFIILAGLFVFGGLAASFLLAPNRPNAVKNATYECGESTIGSSWVQFNVGYYLFALLFLVFDVEAAFLYPWAVVFRDVGMAGLIEGLIFIFVLLIGLVYAWRKGALEWV